MKSKPCKYKSYTKPENIYKIENEEDIENLKIWNINCETCKYRTIHNNKYLFIFFNSMGQSCYACIAGIHSVATCL